VTNQEPPSDPDRASWKRKIGVELSGLERPRDFLVAFLFLVAFVAVAATIAYVAFG
jgi:hypothetical protein